MDELYFLSLKQFKEKFADVRALGDEMITKRYKFYNEKRLFKIEECKKVKAEINFLFYLF